MKLDWLEWGELDPARHEALRALWNRCYPETVRHEDAASFENYLEEMIAPSHRIALEGDEPVAWFAVFTRDDERWILMMVREDHQRRGLGQRMLEEAKEREELLCGWVVDHDRDRLADGSPYPSPLPFYLSQGFEVVPGVRWETPRLSTLKIRWETGQGV